MLVTSRRTGHCRGVFRHTAILPGLLKGTDCSLIKDLVAEELLDEPLADAWELVEFIENGGIAMSETDAAMAQGFTVEDVEETMRLLSDHWPEVQQAAEWEISKMAPLTPQN